MTTHGKPKSACCGVRLVKETVGEWVEYHCTQCGQHTDEKGNLYHYGVTEATRKQS